MDLIGRWFMARRFIGGLCGSRMTAKWNQSDATTLELVELQTDQSFVCYLQVSGDGTPGLSQQVHW